MYICIHTYIDSLMWSFYCLVVNCTHGETISMVFNCTHFQWLMLIICLSMSTLSLRFLERRIVFNKTFRPIHLFDKIVSKHIGWVEGMFRLGEKKSALLLSVCLCLAWETYSKVQENWIHFLKAPDSRTWVSRIF